MAQASPARVSVFTEWEPLEEIIVGNAVNFNHLKLDDWFRFMYQNWEGDFRGKRGDYELARQFIEERQEDLDGIQRIMEARGITVKRPATLDNPGEIRTPYIDTVMNACDSPRDIVICIGDTIIETPCTNPKRYLEDHLFKGIFGEYFRSGARWIAAPRPTMSPASADFSFWEQTFNEPVYKASEIEPDLEIAFDAANCLKFGKDIVMNVGTKNHMLGAEWLQRSLGPDYRVHAIRLTDSHIDWQIMPLAPGRMLVHDHYMRSKYDRLPGPLQDWERIPIADQPHEFSYPAGHLQMASSQGMDINGLSLDERTFMIRDSAVRTADSLYKAGFDVIPVRLRHCELFGDSVHCSTLDVRRVGKLTDYFGGGR